MIGTACFYILPVVGDRTFFKRSRAFKKEQELFQKQQDVFDAFLLVLHNMAKYLVFFQKFQLLRKRPVHRLFG